MRFWKRWILVLIVAGECWGTCNIRTDLYDCTVEYDAHGGFDGMVEHFRERWGYSTDSTSYVLGMYGWIIGSTKYMAALIIETDGTACDRWRCYNTCANTNRPLIPMEPAPPSEWNGSYSQSRYIGGTFPTQPVGCTDSTVAVNDTADTVITGSECYELGRENPLKPKIAGTPTANGIWVKYRVLREYDGLPIDPGLWIEEVVTGGCSGVIISGVGSQLRRNARDSCWLEDGVAVCVCMFDGDVFGGSCSQNGLDTACGGEVPFTYDNKNDSILNECNENQPPDTGVQRPDEPLSSDNDSSAMTGTEGMEGFNQLSRDLKEEGALTRDVLQKSLAEQEVTNGWLRRISDQIKGFFGLGGYDTTGVAAAGTGGGAIPDTSIVQGDSGTAFAGLRSKYGPSSDTVPEYNEALVDSMFAPFRLEVYSGDCDCDPDWFVVGDVMGAQDVKMDICDFNLHVVMKPLLMFMAAILLFVFYRDWYIDVMLRWGS